MKPQQSTPDLCDEHGEFVRVAEPVFRDFGGAKSFCGVIRTIRCFEDNSKLAERLAEPGAGGVLVVDGGGSLRCALLGDNLAALAASHGWSGVLINGCVRDVEVLATVPVGVKALAAHPMRSRKRGGGDVDEVVEFAGVSFVPGHYLYADANGVIVSPADLD